jgi:D-alanyl-D-alanine carboxypeptidase
MKKTYFLPLICAIFTLACGGKLAPQTKKTVKNASVAGLEIPKNKRERFASLISALEQKQDFLLYRPVDDTFVPPDLVKLDDYKAKLWLNKAKLLLRREAAQALILMQKDSGELRLTVSSAYRDFNYQKNLYEKSVKARGEEYTKTMIAAPGASQHQLGAAVDFGPVDKTFIDTPAEIWLRENACKYGFSLSYPDGEQATGYAYEPWHYRYITPEGCALQKEFFEGSQQKTLEFLDKYFKIKQRK